MRRLSALCLLLAPVALTVATAVDPALGTDQGFGVYRAHPDATQWHSVLLHWAWLLFVPGMLGLLAPIRRRGAVLARIAWVSVTVGLVTFSALMLADLFLLALEQHQPNEAAERIDTAFQTLPWLSYGWQLPGLVGWAASLVFVPLAAARGRVISWWTAGAAIAGTALYLAFAISPLPLNLSGPVVLIGAYGAAAAQLLRTGAPSTEDDVFGRFRLRAGIVCLIAAPLVFAAGMATAPAAFLEHPRQSEASGFLLHLAWLLFVPAVWTLAERGRRLTGILGLLTVIGLVNFSALMLGDTTDLVTRQLLGNEAADAIAQTQGGYPLFAVGWVLPGFVLTFAGLLAVAISSTVDGVVHWRVPALVAAGLVAFFALGIGPLGAVGPVLLLAGFALAARTLGRDVRVDDAARRVLADA